MTDNDIITLNHLLNKLKGLDHNGWCSVTDGSIDCYPIDEQIEIINDAINSLSY